MEKSTRPSGMGVKLQPNGSNTPSLTMVLVKWQINSWRRFSKNVMDHANVVKLHTVLFPKELSPSVITELSFLFCVEL